MKKVLSLLAFVLLSSFGNNAYSVVNTIPPGASPYATLGAAFAAINAGGPYAGVPVTVFINADEVLAVPVTLGPGASFTSLVFNPFGAITISGSFNEALIILDGADNVTIDGLNTAGNSLKLNNPNIGLNAGSIRASNGATFNTFKNLTCNGWGLANTEGGRTINIGQSIAGTGGNNNNTIEKCIVNGGRRGIQTFGTTGLYTNDNTTIKNCIVKNCSALGIFIGSDVVNNSILDCEIFDEVAAVTKDVQYRAMGLQGMGVTNVLRNRIYDLESLNPATSFIAIISIPAPLSSPGPNAAQVNIINNCVTLMKSNQAGFIYGIAPLSNATTAIYTSNVYNNTVRLAGASTVAVAGQYTGCLVVDVQIVGSNVNLKNNVAINNRTGGDATSLHIGTDLTTYPFAGVLLNSDYNLSKSTDTSASGWDGGYKGSVYRGFGGLQLMKDSACSADVEQHSMFKNVNFTGLNTCVMGLKGGDINGMPIGVVTADINGTPRNPNFPYKGAYEGPALKVLNLGGREQAINNDVEITVVLKTGACGTVSTCTADLKGTSFNSLLCFGDSVAAGPFFIGVQNMNHIETYSAATVNFAGPVVSYDFKPSTATAFGSNLTAAGPPHSFFAGDRNQDGIVDLTDVVSVYTDASVFQSGCRLRSDMDNNGIVDVSDVVVTNNNAGIFVAVANPCPMPLQHVNSFDKEDLIYSSPKENKFIREN